MITKNRYHIPVMLHEVTSGLVTDRNGVYVDATVGGGGHSVELLANLGRDARLICIDRDSDAVCRASELFVSDARVSVLKGNFGDVNEVVQRYGYKHITGILYDLGVSSHQIDEKARGFSYRLDGPLDMRMDTKMKLDAAQIVNKMPFEDLVRLIKQYGEERRAVSIARAIVSSRESCLFKTTSDLRRVIELTSPKMLKKTLARVFQAIRIAVNGELDQLSDSLDKALSSLTVGGRIATISYHSLEDRIIKSRLSKRMRGCTCPKSIAICICGEFPEFVKVGRGRFYPSEEEVKSNPRARSATLRIYEKKKGPYEMHKG